MFATNLIIPSADFPPPSAALKYHNCPKLLLCNKLHRDAPPAIHYAKSFDFLKAYNIPCCIKTTLDPNSSLFHAEILDLIIRFKCPGNWSNSSLLVVERMSGAMTNFVYTITGPSHTQQSVKILLRVYGMSVNPFVDRDAELLSTCRLGSIGICPRLLGVFSNGRFEEYIASDTLTACDIRSPTVIPKIAIQMAKIHCLLDKLDYNASASVGLFDKLGDWFHLAKQNLMNDDSHDSIDLDALYSEIDWLKTNLVDSPVVFAHNDTQYGNILRLRSTGGIMVIDFEYACNNYRGFDIANHFCEWTSDYHNGTPHIMDFDKYPTRKEQIIFFQAYLFESGASTPGDPALKSLCDGMYWECRFFILASHFMWSLWGLIQANSSSIDFDFTAYAHQRIAEYYRLKKEYVCNGDSD